MRLSPAVARQRSARHAAVDLPKQPAHGERTGDSSASRLSVTDRVARVQRRCLRSRSCARRSAVRTTSALRVLGASAPEQRHSGQVLEAAPGIEPGYRDLQSRDASANPLVSTLKVPRGGSLGAAWGLESRTVAATAAWNAARSTPRSSHFHSAPRPTRSSDGRWAHSARGRRRGHLRRATPFGTAVLREVRRVVAVQKR